MSDIRFNNWLHQSGTGGVHQDSAGNIGIGTSVPTTALDVVGVVSATTFSGNVIAPGNSTFSGSVGIGTDNPGGNSLEVYKDQAANTTFSIKNPSTAAGTYASAYISAGSVNGQIYTDANGNAGLQGMTIQTTSNHGLRFNTNSTERARITSGGNVQIANGNLVFSTSGTGIDFSANTAAGTGTTTSSVLDDYEEGTWTPNSSYTFTHATYTKIGRMVQCQFTCTNPSGMASINLPFTPSNTVTGSGNSEQVRYVGDVQMFLSGGNDDSIYKYIWQGNIGASMLLHKISGAGAQTWTASFGSNVSQVTVSLSYIVA